MSAVNWTAEVETLAGPYQGNRKGWLSCAARRADVTYRQLKALYYGETIDPKHSVATRVLSAAEQARKEKATNDAALAAGYLHQRATALSNVDADFHREEILALRHLADAIGRGNRPDRSGDGR